MKQFENRIAVVTGAGSGIGRATSLALAKRGCKLALADVDDAGLEQTQREISTLGAQANTYHVDVSDRARMQRFADEIVSDYGAVHILVNNAGVNVNGRFADQSLEDFEWIMGINFWGVVYGCKFFLPHLVAAGEAHIVNMSSLFGLITMQQQSSYCSSKFAVRGFTESLRVELADTGVGVTCVHPGAVATNIVASCRVRGDEAIRVKHERAVQRFKTRMPPERAANIIVSGIERNSARVLVSPEAHILDLLQRMAPRAPDMVMKWHTKRLSV